MTHEELCLNVFKIFEKSGYKGRSPSDLGIANPPEISFFEFVDLLKKIHPTVDFSRLLQVCYFPSNSSDPLQFATTESIVKLFIGDRGREIGINVSTDLLLSPVGVSCLFAGMENNYPGNHEMLRVTYSLMTVFKHLKDKSPPTLKTTRILMNIFNEKDFCQVLRFGPELEEPGLFKLIIEKKTDTRLYGPVLTRWIPENASLNSLAKFVLSTGDFPNKKLAKWLYLSENNKERIRVLEGR